MRPHGLRLSWQIMTGPASVNFAGHITIANCPMGKALLECYCLPLACGPGGRSFGHGRG